MLQFFRLQFFEKQEEKIQRRQQNQKPYIVVQGRPQDPTRAEILQFFVFNFFEAIEKHQTKIKKDNKIKSLTLLSRSGPRMQPKQKIHQKILPQFFLLQSHNLKMGFKAMKWPDMTSPLLNHMFQDISGCLQYK